MIGGYKNGDRPKRRKKMDNPYNLKIINNNYYIIFKSNNKYNEVEVTKEVFDLMNRTSGKSQ